MHLALRHSETLCSSTVHHLAGARRRRNALCVLISLVLHGSMLALPMARTLPVTRPSPKPPAAPVISVRLVTEEPSSQAKAAKTILLEPAPPRRQAARKANTTSPEPKPGTAAGDMAAITRDMAKSTSGPTAHVNPGKVQDPRAMDHAAPNARHHAPGASAVAHHTGRREDGALSGTTPADEHQGDAFTAQLVRAAYQINPAPQYPLESRRRGERGRVVLLVHIQPDGIPASVEVAHSSGYVRLDQAARRAVARWKFSPAMQGQQAVGAWVHVPIAFRLDG